MAETEVNILEGLSKAWQKFFKKFDEIDDIKVSTWKDVHILAYICKRYEQLYKQKFAITIKGAPSKSPEMYFVKSIKAMLGTTSSRIIKEYIDWVYDKKIIPKRVKFRKVGFFITPGFVNEFNFDRKKGQEISRSSKVPDAYKKMAEELGVDIDTYGDLAFLYLAMEKSKNYSSPSAVLIQNLELVGLDLNKLREIK